MTRKEKLSKYETDFNCKVLQDAGKYIFVQKGEYIYKIDFNNRYKIKFNISLMTEESYLEFLNKEKFYGTPLKAIKVIDKNRTRILNEDTGEYNDTFKCNINIKSLLHITSKVVFYKEQIKKALGDFYSYDKTITDKTDADVIVTCPIHGDFKVSFTNAVYSHSGCPECARLRRKFGRNGFIKLCKENNSTGKLYLIELYNSEERFYKIGITQRDIKERCRLIPYKTRVLYIIEGEPGEIWDKEFKIHRALFEYRYTPKKSFAGKGECYRLNEDVEKIVKL